MTVDIYFVILVFEQLDVQSQLFLIRQDFHCFMNCVFLDIICVILTYVDFRLLKTIAENISD